MTIIDWIQAISMVILAIITGIYAWLTHVMSKAANKQADASMKIAEAVFKPIITIQRGSADSNNKMISANLKNEGLGPALNLKWYLTHKEFGFNGEFSVYTTFKVGQDYPLSIPSENFDFEAWNSLAINCDYQSISGKNFRSILRFETEKERRFEILEIEEGNTPK